MLQPHDSTPGSRLKQQQQQKKSSPLFRFANMIGIKLDSSQALSLIRDSKSHNISGKRLKRVILVRHNNCAPFERRAMAMYQQVIYNSNTSHIFPIQSKNKVSKRASFESSRKSAVVVVVVVGNVVLFIFHFLCNFFFPYLLNTHFKFDADKQTHTQQKKARMNEWMARKKAPGKMSLKTNGFAISKQK